MINKIKTTFLLYLLFACVGASYAEKQCRQVVDESATRKIVEDHFNHQLGPGFRDACPNVPVVDSHVRYCNTGGARHYEFSIGSDGMFSSSLYSFGGSGYVNGKKGVLYRYSGKAIYKEECEDPEPQPKMCYRVDIEAEKKEFRPWFEANIPPKSEDYVVLKIEPEPYTMPAVGHIVIWYKKYWDGSENSLYIKHYSRPWRSETGDICEEGTIDPDLRPPPDKPHPPKGGEDGDKPGGEDGDKPGGEDGDKPGGEDGDKPGGGDGDKPGGGDGDKPVGGDGDKPGGGDGDKPGGGDGDKPGGGDGDKPGGGNGTGDGDGKGNYDKSDLDCKGSNCSGTGHGKGNLPTGSAKDIYESDKEKQDLGKYIVDNLPDVRSSKLGRELNKLIPVLPVGQCPRFEIKGFSMMGHVLMKPQPIDIPCWIYDLMRAFLLIGAVIYSRKLIFGA